MKTKRTRWWLKSAALLCATVFGLTAFGDYYKEWSATDKACWDGDSSWTDVGDTTSTLTDYRVGTTGAQIAFDKAIEGDSVNLYVYNGSTTFSADDASYGLTKPSWFCAGVWFGGAATATFESGTYSFSEINVGRWDSGTGSSLAVAGASVTAPTAYIGSDTLAGSVTITSGTLTASIDGGSQGTLTLNGGTLATTSVANIGSLAVGANGGTFANDAAATISVALTGSGTLTKTGSGTLAITGDISAFKGKIAVAEGAGSVTIGETIIAAGQEVQFGVYTWTGAGTATTTTDEGTGVETTTYTDADLWSNVNNWLVNGSIPATAPAADSTVVIPAGDGKELTIKISNANEYTGYLTINRDVKFARTASDRDYYNSIYLTQVSGSGTLTLEAGGGYSSTDRQGDRIHLTPAGASLPFQIDTDLVVNGRIRVMRNGNVVPTLTLNGALKGTGYLYFNNYHNGEGARLNGDTSEFAGVFEGGGANGFARDATKFDGDARGSELASWKFGRWDLNANATYGFTPFLVNDVTYQFGQLDAPLLHFWRGFSGSNTTGATVEVGALAGKTSTVTGSLAPNNTLRKVGATSTLKYTNSGTANGTVEAYEGTTVILGTATGFTLNFTGTGAIIKIARSTTTETDSGEEDDESTTDVDESKTVTTTTNIPSTFVPGFGTALAGYQYDVTQETTDGVTYDVYTVLTDVATDSAGTTYDSVALAIAAIEADETGTLTKAITLAKSTTEAVALPLGYSLVLDGNTVGSVTGVAGVAVSYNEETGTWTTVDNSEATWQGGAEGNWFNAANWSSGYVPDAGTAVTFTGNATVFLADNDTYDCGSIYISRDNATVTFAPVDYNESNWPRVKVYGNIGAHGDCVLKLYRCGIDNGTDGRITVRPTVTFENTTGDSWFTGNFDLQAGLNGTGEFRIYGGTIHFATGSGITVADGSVVDFRNYYPTFEGRSGTLHSTGVNGDGRIIVHALPTDSALTYFQNAFKNAERWSGTLELAGLSLTSVRWLNQYGNANSTVSFNNTTTYLYTSQRTDGNHNVGIEVASGGLTIGGQYSSGDFVFPGKLTGTGTLTVAITGNNNKNVQFTGDCSEFAGKIAWTDGTVNTRVVVGDDTSAEFAAKTIVVNEDATIGLSGFGGTLVGSGTVLFKAATGLGTFGEAWMGVAVADFALTSGANCQLNSLGTANSVVANGQAFTGHLNGNYSMVPALRLDNDFTFNNGSSSTTAWPESKITKFSRVLGDKNLNITWDNPNTGAVAYYEVEKIDGSYTGTINVSAKSALRVDEVALSAEPEVGVRLASIAVTAGGALVNADTESVLDGATVALTVAGEAIEEVAVYDTDGLYVAVAKVGDDYYVTYEAAAAAAEAAVEGTEDTASFTVLYGDGVMNGWDYDSEAGTLTKNTTAIARVGTTQYDTLAEAVAAEGATEIVLFGASAENVTLAAEQTLDVTTSAYTGKVTGSGTFVLDWDTSAATDSTAWELNNYGVSGSTVVIARPITKGYIKAPVSSSKLHNVAPAVYLKANVSITNGFATNPDAENPVDQTTTFSQLGADEGVTLSFRYQASAQVKDTTLYAITKLKDFAGSFVLNAYNQVTVESVELAGTPAFGTKVVNATIADTASLSGKIAEGYPLVAKADGLYFDPVAQVGEAYYNTLADAVTAANGATVALVKSTADGVVVAAGQTVVIQFGEYSTGDIAAATDYILNTSWDDATKTGTYTTTAVAAYLTVGETVTPYTVAYTALTDFIASATGSTLRFVGTNPFADTAVPCTTYDAATLTYTKLAAVAQIGTGPSAIQYPTLAEACTAAEQYGYGTVTLLVALGEQTVPDGWDYNAPAEGEEGFGTLTKEVTVTYNVWFVDTDGSTQLAPYQTVENGSVATKPATDPVKEGYTFVAWTLGGTAYDFTTPVTSAITLIASWKDAPTGTEADDGSGNKFTVPATVATPADKTLTDAAAGTINYAQAYALGLWDGTAEGEVAEPTVSINIVDGKVQVAFAGGTVPEAYTVTSILQYKTALGTTSEWQNVEGDGATGALGATLVDQSEMGANKFYRVIVTITNK